MLRTKICDKGNFSLFKGEDCNSRYENVFYVVVNILTGEEKVYLLLADAYRYLNWYYATFNIEMD